MADMLFDLLLRVVAVLLVATIAVTVLHRTSASLRALMWTATLAGALVLPFITLTAPPLGVAVLRAEPVVPVRGAGQPSAAHASTERTAIARATHVNSTSTSTLADQRIASATDRREPTLAGSPELHVPRPANDWIARVVTNISMTTILVGVWLIGALLLLVRLGLSHKRLGTLVSSAGSAGHHWHAAVDVVRAELGIRRRVEVRMSRDLDVPVMAGVFTPVLLVPASIDIPAHARRDVVLHELAHVVRWDALAQLLSNLACAVYWFIPLTWVAARHAASLREQACDNVVLRAGTRPSQYARRLLTFAYTPMSTALEPVALAMARPSRIHRRVRGILDPHARRTHLSASFTTAFIASSFALVSFVAIVEPVAASEPVRLRDQRAEQPPVSANVPVTAGVPVSDVVPTGMPTVRISPSTLAATSIPAAAHVPPLPVGHTMTPAGIDAGEALVPGDLNTPRIPSMVAQTLIAVQPDFSGTDMVFPVTVNAETPQQASVLCRGGTNSHSIHSNSTSETRRITAKGPGCDVSIRIEGKPTFNREFTDVVSISGRGTFEVDVRENGTRRELRIRDNGGQLTRTWRVDGQERSYDADAAAWFAQILIALDRQTAFAVDERLPLLLERGGVGAVLAETGQMSSDHARTAYYKALSKSRQLTTQELTNVLNQAAELTKSDYYSAELLRSVARQGLGEPPVRDGVMRMISGMTSDYYIAESIKSTVNASRPSAGELSLLLQVVGTMKSDYYRSEAVKVLTRTADLSPTQLSDVLSIASKMKSDHHINEMLGSLVSHGPLDSEKRVAYIAATRSIDSDYHRAEALGKLLRNGAPAAGEMDLLFASIGEIESDHYMGEVLDRLLAFRSLREADLLRAEVVARSINSNHTHANVLRRIGGHASATDAVRSAVHATAASLSRHYRELVQRGVER